MAALMRLLSLSLGFSLLSACSEVFLDYHLPPTQPGLSAVSLESGKSASVPLAQNLLRLLPQVKVQAADLQNLSVYVTLTPAGGGTQRDLRFSAEQLLQGDMAEILNLPVGQYRLAVQLQNSKQEVQASFEKTLSLAADQILTLPFLLEKGEKGSELRISEPEQGASSSPAGALSSESETSSGMDAGAGGGSSSSGLGSSHSAGPAPRNLRILESSSSRLQMVWEAPLNQTVQYYRLYRNGVLVADHLPVTNYTLEGLFADQDYQLSVTAVSAAGESLPLEMKAHTAASNGGGGGGGGGGSGGGSSSGGGAGSAGGQVAVNHPPVIQSLTASKTSLPGVGAPVQLTCLATDEQVLPSTAYTWSCSNCGNASFGSTHGASTVWTAPDLPGTYTIKVQVSDGVNPAVERTQTLVVTQLLADVVVNGVYQ